MAYPFTAAIHYGEFKDRIAREFDVTTVRLRGTLIDPQGAVHDVYYFERRVGDRVLRAPVPDLPDDTIVLFSVMRSVCARLEISARAFGLELGWVQ